MDSVRKNRPSGRETFSRLRLSCGPFWPRRCGTARASPARRIHICRTVPIRLVIVRDPAGRQEDDFFFCTDATVPDTDRPTMLGPLGRGGMYPGGQTTDGVRVHPRLVQQDRQPSGAPGVGVGDTGEGRVPDTCCRRAFVARGTDAVEPAQDPALVPGYAGGSASCLVATSNFTELKVYRTSPRNSRNRFLRAFGGRMKWLNHTQSRKRVAGIEPAWPAWKAGALPLSYTRDGGLLIAGSRSRIIGEVLYETEIKC